MTIYECACVSVQSFNKKKYIFHIFIDGLFININLTTKTYKRNK